MPLEPGEALVNVPAVTASFDVLAVIHDVDARLDLTVNDALDRER
jgi:hypothetical protein